MMSLFKRARAETTRLFPDYMIAFGGLCGVDLNHYNRLPAFHILQPVIDDTVNTLNYAIHADNINHHVYHPTLTSNIHLKRKGKSQRNQYRLLWDGVHPTEHVLKDWAVNIRKFHINNHRAFVAKATCPSYTYSSVIQTSAPDPSSGNGKLKSCGPTVYEQRP